MCRSACSPRSHHRRRVGQVGSSGRGCAAARGSPLIIRDEQDCQRLEIREGQAPKLMAIVTDENYDIIDPVDIASVDVTILNTSTGDYVLEEEALTVTDVLLDDFEPHSYKESPDGETLTINCNFLWPTLSEYFITTGDDCSFLIEIWAVPADADSERFLCGVWKVDVQHSARPSHEPEEDP